jgi:hypothetical protein
MLLAHLDAPFEHPDWIFEPKMDGFRAVAYVEGGTCRLVSRNRNAFKTLEPLAHRMRMSSAQHRILRHESRPSPRALLAGLPSRRARSCVLGGTGRPMFYQVMRRRGPFCFYAPDRDQSVLRSGPTFLTRPKE